MASDNPGYDLDNLDKLAAADWDDTLPKVYKFARWKCFNYALLGYDFDPESLVEEAIARAYGSGTSSSDEPTYRNWNQDIYPDLADFLISIIKSILSHLKDHHSAFKLESLNDDENEENYKISKLDSEAQSACFLNGLIKTKTPEEQLILKSQRKEFREFLDELSLSDEEVGMALMAYEDGAEKAADVAEVTGFEIKKVYNINKRLSRKILQFLKLNEMNGWERIAR
jgi:DNA-directed RNA polymerase specialized sigma24 family protein